MDGYNDQAILVRFSKLTGMLIRYLLCLGLTGSRIIIGSGDDAST